MMARITISPTELMVKEMLEIRLRESEVRIVWDSRLGG